MKIRSFEYSSDARGGWSLSKIDLHSGINLFVGASGAGKTRALNMLTNICAFASTGQRFCDGTWTMHFDHDGKDYTWRFSGKFDEDRKPEITSEELWEGGPMNEGTLLFIRDKDQFLFKDKAVPKLSPHNSCIFLLREEDAISKAHDGFSQVLRRNFFGEDLNSAVALATKPVGIVKRLEKKKSIDVLYKNGAATFPLGVRLSLVQEFFPQIYDQIKEHFQRVFPFVKSMSITIGSEMYELPFAGDIPVLHIGEGANQRPVPLQEMSSGMQKVLLIITDILTAPSEMLYMIDEYENSLGVNAIDFLAPFLIECGGDRQFIVTSHHPILINAIPVLDWYVFHRKGTRIEVVYGPQLADRYGVSKQQKFTQLLNDPIFAEGVE